VTAITAALGVGALQSPHLQQTKWSRVMTSVDIDREYNRGLNDELDEQQLNQVTGGGKSVSWAYDDEAPKPADPIRYTYNTITGH
jgi:hypothetical protein